MPMLVGTARGVFQVTGDQILFGGDWEQVRRSAKQE
jgi:hypothetical protein